MTETPHQVPYLPAPPPPAAVGQHVSVIVVSADGMRWLTDVLDALDAQGRRPDAFVAVDVASADGSRELLAQRFPGPVLDVPAGTVYGAAVARAVASLPNDGDSGEQWLWLLHDDSAPAPDALGVLLDRVAGSNDIWVAGPKVRDWDGRALRQAGLGVHPDGTVVTGVEAGEPDQGQLDDADDVLAVSTAGALVRRTAWDQLGGLDAEYAPYADDVDLGWRVNAAGFRVVVAPQAVVRHAASLVDRALTAGEPDPTRARRRHLMQAVLANGGGRALPLLVARQLVGALARLLSVLVVHRRPHAARAELAALGDVIASPGDVRRARRERAGSRRVSDAQLRRLFPGSTPRRRLAVGGAESDVDRDARSVDRSRTAASYEPGPVDADAESLRPDDSVLGRLFRRPETSLTAVLLVLSLMAERGVLTGSDLHGGRLLAAPGGASDLWSTYLSSWHAVGVGSTTASPPSTALLALLASVLLGKAWLAVDLLVVGAVPLAALSAFTALRPVATSARLRAAVAVGYALLPSVTGAVAGGRLDVVVVAIVLPQLVGSLAATVWQRADDDRRRGQPTRTGLLLAVAVAFAPVLWPLAAVAVVAALVVTRTAGDDRSAAFARFGYVLALPLLLLLPWTAHVVTHPRLLVAGIGLPESYSPHGVPSGVSLLRLRAGGVGQPPLWVGAPLLAIAVVGLVTRLRPPVMRLAAVLVVVGLALAVAETRMAGVTASEPTSRWWPGTALLVVAAGLLLAVTVVAADLPPVLARRDFSWRQPFALLLAAAAVVAAATAGVGWLHRGPGSLRTGSTTRIPLFTLTDLRAAQSPRALVLRGSTRRVRYSLVRSASGLQLGQGEVLPGDSGAATDRLGDAVADLVAGRPAAGAELAEYGVVDVVVRASSRTALTPGLSRLPTLTPLAGNGTGVWRSSLPAGEVTLVAASAAPAVSAGRPAPTGSTTTVRASDTGSTVTVPAGPAGRLLVVAEPAGGPWRATVDGRRLASRTAYGWAQAFVLPAGGGPVHVAPTSGKRPWLLTLELVLTLLVLGAALPRSAS